MEVYSGMDCELRVFLKGRLDGWHFTMDRLGWLRYPYVFWCCV